MIVGRIKMNTRNNMRENENMIIKSGLLKTVFFKN